MLARLIALLALPALIPPAVAATLTVAPGPGTPFADALRRARDGDTIDVLPGDYRGDVAAIERHRLTIRGVGGTPVFHAAGRIAEGKAIWVVRGEDVVIENIEFRGARAGDRNGAGVRVEQGRVTLRRCAFQDNQMGVMTSNDAKVELQVEDSLFARAPRDPNGFHHLLYVGLIKRVSITGSRFHEGYIGHLIKSRARETRIEYNLLVDGPQGRSSYEIDLPNGGDARIVGNVVHQGAETSNPVVIAYGAEGQHWPVNRLHLAHNTLVSDAWAAWFLRVWKDKLPADTAVHALNNLTVGAGSLGFVNSGEFSGNYPAFSGMLLDIPGLAYQLNPGSLLRGRGTAPKADDGVDLAPRREFTLPMGSKPVAPPAEWSPGAFQR